MFTPQEVSEKVFPKASFGSGGYSMTSVDEFLDALTEDYTALFKENMTLKAKLKVLAEKVESRSVICKPIIWIIICFTLSVGGMVSSFSMTAI